MSKRNDAIFIMNENASLPMADVVKLIAEKIGVTEANAKSYYRWIVANGKAPGAVEKSTRAAKSTATPKAPKAKAPKLIKPKLDMSATKDRKPVTDKTVEEIADIRAKNLARLKAVGQKYANQANGKEGGFTAKQAKEAREYVAAVTNDLDSFKAPSFLSMSDVKALV